jgi:hypothetical protein
MTGTDNQVTTPKPFDYRIFLVRLEGFEPPTPGSEDRCSIPLSYSRIQVQPRTSRLTVTRVDAQDEIVALVHQLG